MQWTACPPGRQRRLGGSTGPASSLDPGRAGDWQAVSLLSRRRFLRSWSVSGGMQTARSTSNSGASMVSQLTSGHQFCSVQQAVKLGAAAIEQIPGQAWGWRRSEAQLLASLLPAGCDRCLGLQRVSDLLQQRQLLSCQVRLLVALHTTPKLNHSAQESMHAQVQAHLQAPLDARTSLHGGGDHRLGDASKASHLHAALLL